MSEQKYLDEGNATGCTPLPDDQPTQPTKPELVRLVAPERKRTYRYADGSSVEFENVTHVGVRASGSHRLETADGKKHIILAGFIAITLDMDNWTF